MEPWVARPPAKWCRLMTPAKPLPLLMPVTFTLVFASKALARTLSPGLEVSAASTLISRSTRTGATPCFSQWPFSALEARLPPLGST